MDWLSASFNSRSGSLIIAYQITAPKAARFPSKEFKTQSVQADRPLGQNAPSGAHNGGENGSISKLECACRQNCFSRNCRVRSAACVSVVQSDRDRAGGSRRGDD